MSIYRISKLKYLFATCVILHGINALANWDYQASFFGRTLPFGGIPSGTVGYNFLVWGEDPRPQLPQNGPPTGTGADWRFGYVRPYFTAQSNVFTSRAIGEIDLFPVSIFGVTLGQAYQARINQSTQFDCTQVLCGGVLNRSYVRLQTVVGTHGFYAAGWLRFDWISHPDSSMSFLEESTALVGAPGSDRMAHLTVALGYSPNQEWIVGASAVQSRVLTSSHQSFTSFLFGNYYTGPWSFLLGAGTYSSSHQALSPTVLMMIQWMGKRPLGWF